MTAAQVRVEDVDREKLFVSVLTQALKDRFRAEGGIAKIMRSTNGAMAVRNIATLEAAEVFSRLAIAAAPGVPEGYSTAFYEIAAMLGIGARPASPETVWRDEMKPALQSLLAAAPTPPTTHQGGAAEMREAAAQVVDEHGRAWGLSYRSMTDNLSTAIRSLPLPAAEAPQGWRPIDEAPEGNEDQGPFFDVAWIGETHRYLPTLRREPDCYRQGNSIKRQHSYPAVTTVFLRKPTHFMLTPSLPAAPSTLREGEGA